MSSSETAEEKNARITILYDNNEHDNRLETAWGFSCLVEGFEKTILFDTGGNGSLLLSNMRKLDIDPAEVDAVVLSHAHGDHIGGLGEFLDTNRKVTVYLPRAFPSHVKRMVRGAGAEVVEVHEPAKVCDAVYCTGELNGGIREQSLLLKTATGAVLITGCAHPGIVNIVRHAEERLGTEISMAMGGFHLSGARAPSIQEIVRELKILGVGAIAPCHCSGDLARTMFKQAYGDNFYAAGVGWRHTLARTRQRQPETE